ncbi:hypothetical protein NDU88_005992 [Pleurodeles waltl]|uniref:Uncharacterized protein n=1 Tax=Pleurodeles waltl TaxID=8319 RepID=A0AAV7WZG6_PLEWA|nr:hypothetical protein NDU88_005992 [Pleurodeles waltl]
MSDALDRRCPQGRPLPRRAGPVFRTGPAPRSSFCAPGPTEPGVPSGCSGRESKGPRGPKKSPRPQGCEIPKGVPGPRGPRPD